MVKPWEHTEMYITEVLGGSTAPSSTPLPSIFRLRLRTTHREVLTMQQDPREDSFAPIPVHRSMEGSGPQDTPDRDLPITSEPSSAFQDTAITGGLPLSFPHTVMRQKDPMSRYISRLSR